METWLSTMRSDLFMPRQLASLLFTCLIVAAALAVLWPFSLAIIWAMIIAIASWPLHERIAARCGGRRDISAIITTGLMCIALVGPMVIVLVMVTQDLISVASFLIRADTQGIPAPAWLIKLPWFGNLLESKWDIYLARPNQLSDVLHQTINAKLNVIQEAAHSLLVDLAGRIATLFFALWILYFLYRDGKSMNARLNAIGYKWLERRWPAYVYHVPEALRAAVNGLVIVAFAEGVLLSLLFFFCGVPSAVLFGLLTALLAFVPMLAPVVLLLFGLVLFASGATAAAVSLVIIGLVIIMGADYVVRPMLIQGGTQLPFLGILFGIFGGVLAMGVVGLIIGPVVLVLLLVFFREAALDESRLSLDFYMPTQAAIVSPSDFDTNTAE